MTRPLLRAVLLAGVKTRLDGAQQRDDRNCR
jgi:hypothetical protein